MAQEWFSKGALGAELQYIIDNCVVAKAAKVILLKAYTAGDSFTDVHVTNNIGSADILETDFSGIIDGTPTTSQRMSFTGAGPTDGANTLADAGTDLFIAIVNVTDSEVLAVTDETSNQPISVGNPLTFPTFYMQANQPVGG
jgi:hypothetical protein